MSKNNKLLKKLNYLSAQNQHKTKEMVLGEVFASEKLTKEQYENFAGKLITVYIKSKNINGVVKQYCLI